MKTKTVKIKLPKWAIEKLDWLLKCEFCQNRGFKMNYSDLIAEMIANFHDPQEYVGEPTDETHTA